MLSMIAAAALAMSAPPSCPPLDPAEQVNDQRKLGRSGLKAATTSHPGDGPFGFVSSRVTVFLPNCSVAFDRKFDDQEKADLDIVEMAGQHLLVVTTFRLGGSTCDIDHLVLSYEGGLIRGSKTIRVLTPMELQHSESGGFYVGNLGEGRGPGLAIWDPLIEGEAHLAPHRFQMTVYRWIDGRFSAPTVLTTRRTVGGDDNVPQMLGYPLHDQTNLDRFGGC